MYYEIQFPGREGASSSALIELDAVAFRFDKREQEPAMEKKKKRKLELLCSKVHLLYFGPELRRRKEWKNRKFLEGLNGKLENNETLFVQKIRWTLNV